MLHANSRLLSNVEKYRFYYEWFQRKYLLSQHFLSHMCVKEYQDNLGTSLQAAALNFMIFTNFTGHELLVWYGDDYASDLGIEKENYSASVIPGTGILKIK